MEKTEKTREYHRFFSAPVKNLTRIIMLFAAVIFAITSSWYYMGRAGGLTTSEIREQTSYESSRAAAEYLQEETQKILETMSWKKLYAEDGYHYNAGATIDIFDSDAGVQNKAKNEDTEYVLSDLQKFYNSDGYVLLQFLNEYDWPYLVEDYSGDMQLLFEDYLGSSYGDIHFGEEAEKVTETASLSAAAGDENPFAESLAGKPYTNFTIYPWANYDYDESITVGYTFRVYSDYEDTICYNGYEWEKQFILTAKDTTLAELALQDDTDRVQFLLGAYTDLIQVTEDLVSQTVDSYSEETNALFYASDLSGGTVFTNVEDWMDISAGELEELYTNGYTDEESGPCFISLEERNGAVVSADQINFSGNEAEVESLLEAYLPLLSDVFVSYNGHVGNYYCFVALDTRFPLKDSVSYRNHYFINRYVKFEEQYPLLTLSFPLMLVSGIVTVLMLIFMAFQTGKSAENGDIHGDWTDKIPLELMLVMDLLFLIFSWVLITVSTSRVSSNYSDYDSITGMYGELLGMVVPGTLLLVFTIAISIHVFGLRLKRRALGGSVLAWCIRYLRDAWKKFYQSKKENQKLVLRLIGIAAVHIVALLAIAASCGMLYVSLPIILILLAIFDFFVIRAVFRNARGKDEIRRGMEEISNGNLHYQIDTAGMSEENLQMASLLNQVQNGLQLALDSEMKSERLKADLITNVSHDIKTPLTSIINYVDLLKRENIQDPKIAGYIEVLERKSGRLKQLTEDLVEASKISSGNITLEWQEFNLKQLIKQTNGEFEEKFEQRNLSLICELPEEDMRICADPRRMYRVIENLYNNAVKYSMPGSRVYVKGQLNAEKVIFSIKNMSENPLNFSAEELMERFVRGDVSRNTEGSGLGLEIARNLTVMQKGSFDLYLDGDLFKVVITFDRV